MSCDIIQKFALVILAVLLIHDDHLSFLSLSSGTRYLNVFVYASYLRVCFPNKNK